MGLLNNLISFSLLLWGQTRIASGLASIFNAAMPVVAILVTRVLAPQTKRTRYRIAGMGLGIAGVAVLMGGDAMWDRDFALLATLACLGAALSSGFAGFFGQPFCRMAIAPATGTFGPLAALSVVMTAMVVFVDKTLGLGCARSGCGRCACCAGTFRDGACLRRATCLLAIG